MKKLKMLREFQIKPTTTRLVIGGTQEYYCWTSGSFTFISDSDRTGESTEDGTPVNCTAIAEVEI